MAAAVSGGSAAQWLLGPLAFVLAVSVWLAPMLLAAQTDPALAAYRDEILFRQTIDRYANAWHHREPFWYFLVNVIPVLVVAADGAAALARSDVASGAGERRSADRSVAVVGPAGRSVLQS